MKRTKFLPPEGMKYRIKTDIIWELHNIPGQYYTFQIWSLCPEMFSLEKVQETAIEYGIEIFEIKKK